MDNKTKDELRKIINNLKKDENVLLITNDTCYMIGTIRNIFTNIILSSLQNDEVKQLLQLLRKL